MASAASLSPNGCAEGGPGDGGTASPRPATRTKRPAPTAEQLAAVAAKTLLSYSDLMIESGMCRETIRQAIRDGRLYARKWGRNVVVHRRDWEAFIDSLGRAA